jgi:hypothetical protein
MKLFPYRCCARPPEVEAPEADAGQAPASSLLLRPSLFGAAARAGFSHVGAFCPFQVRPGAHFQGICAIFDQFRLSSALSRRGHSDPSARPESLRSA